MEPPIVVWRALQALGQLPPSVATALVRMRDAARQAGLANREIAGPHARHIEYARWLREHGGLSDA
jgi:hypothetical protein